jgi:hypothetical protein
VWNTRRSKSSQPYRLQISDNIIGFSSTIITSVMDSAKVSMSSKRPPIFILGNRRSGTTLLRLLLTCHRDIVIPPEGGFIWTLGWKYDWIKEINRIDVANFVNDLFKLDNTQDWEIDRKSLLCRLEELVPCEYPLLIDGVYCEYAEKRFPGKNRWGDKTTGYLDFLPQLRRYFPYAQYIHIVRDGRSVVASFKNVPHLSSHIEDASLEWIQGIRQVGRFRRTVNPDRFIEIKYEDLVSNPEKQLRNLCEFLHEPYDAEMLNYWKLNRRDRLEPERHLGWKYLTLEKITTRRISSWQDELSKEEVERFLLFAWKELSRLGYTDESDLSIFRPMYWAWFYVILYSAVYLFVRVVKAKLRPLKACISYQFKRNFRT